MAKIHQNRHDDLRFLLQIRGERRKILIATQPVGRRTSAAGPIHCGTAILAVVRTCFLSVSYQEARRVRYFAPLNIIIPHSEFCLPNSLFSLPPTPPRLAAAGAAAHD